MAKKPLKDRVISIRVTAEEHASLEAQRARTNLKPSQFGREMLLNKTPVFNEASVHGERIVFLVNKASNNLNQLAHQVNQASRRGITSERVYLLYLNKLASIEHLLQVGILYVDQG